MYLKKIEAQGFKSFANKIVLEFSPGIMGIVGPNGSGKSNVADAVRWVLGEQSAKQLRGSNMQDVIFSGTENRKPQGYASVALTIDNSDHMLAIDYDEVTIARRVYRSGESEYLINGNNCRLRDVNELFYDTGVGKEGYSIIGQGQIDKILSGKPEDRRELFDEAAGIVKYKKRKTIAQRKLEDEQQNLVRVSDILGELEKQVGPLAKQSEKARQYLKLKEELKSYELGAFFLESTEWNGKLATAKENLIVVNGDLEKCREEADALRQRYEALTEKNEALEREIEARRSELSEDKVQKENLEGKIRVLEEQIRTAKLQDEHLQERVGSIEEEIKARTGEKETFVAEKGELNQQLDRADDRLGRLESKVTDVDDSIRALEFETESKKQQIIAGLNEKAEIGANRQKFMTQLEQTRLTRSELHQYLLTAKTEEEEKKQQVNSLKTQLEEIQGELASLRSEQQKLETFCAEQEKAIRQKRIALNECQQNYHAGKSRLDSLINITERYEGYGNSIRRVMEKKNQVPGIVGVVADLFHVEKKFEVAMETALGGRIQNIVTDTEETAKQLVEYLKKNKLGRATFLPISSVNGKDGFPRPEALKEPGALGVANKLVQVDAAYEGIASYLLGRVLVVDTIDHALSIARKFRHSLSIVTLDGEHLSPGGSLTGGAFKNSSNLLGRRREMEELEQKIQTILKQQDEIKNEAAQMEQTLDQSRKRLGALQEAIQEKSIQQNTVFFSVKREQEALTAIQNSYFSREEDSRRVQEKIDAIENQEAEMIQALEALENQSKTCQKEIERLEKKLEKEKAKREEVAKELETAKVEFSNLSQKDAFLLENILRVNRELERLRGEKAELLSGGQGADQIRQREEEIGQIRDQIHAMEENMRQLTETIETQIKIKEADSAEQKKFFDAREEINGRVNALDKEAFRLQNQTERLEEHLEKQVEYLWTEYEMTPSEAEAQKPDDLGPLLEVRRNISKRKTEIRELGPVNVNAIEDYKEVSERYEFLKVQHADLVEAEASLQKIIEELDEAMRSQFEEKFAAIRQEFQKVFEELFGGGRGTLELLDADDVLEAGIAINAQPPGKKLQNMLQLSGGEKALTAIALLFAIQNLKPSPFCLLDEIEAALDEPNVARYAEYLNKLKKHTQFIVITHRRGTMEMSDRLYGVTMQEKGVSALVSVDLTDPNLVSEKR
ncbi:chromosome segregation protein SMC [Hominifimenecus sp. rT4P-3]|uniref:chromosome segregation protein SMC n=1 Tax=Hominifimenecus sp. rT4P-3 TaxID=3242979 RepID=UPI003DA4B309